MTAQAQDRVMAGEEMDGVGAAAEALHWAETAAHRGDFDFAVRWLERAEGLLGGLTPLYQRRKRTWQAAAATELSG
jgi:hypothetical protein